jgi:hypothetical protein
MQLASELIRFLIQNLDILLGALVPVIALLKLTAWGRANAEALDALVRAVENLGAKDVKTAIALEEGKLSDVAQDVLRDAVARADQKKSARTAIARIARELGRGLFPVK